MALKKKKKAAFGGRMLLTLAAILVAGGTFYVASAADFGDPVSLMGAAIAAFTGQPTVTIQIDPTTTEGTIPMNATAELARFNVDTRNVTHWATVGVSGQVAVTTSSPAPLRLSNFVMQYSYCIPVGKTYGYGYKGGNCASVPLNVTVSQSNATTYVLNFSLPPIYPEASESYFTVTATPTYAYTGSFSYKGAKDGKVQATIENVYATGDQCSIVRYGYKNKYSYQGHCAAKTATVRIAGKGSMLTVVRTPGFGYNPAPVPVVACSITLDPLNAAPNSPRKLTWATSNATSFTLTNFQGTFTEPLNGSSTVTPSTAITYTGKATGPGGSVTCTASGTVTTVPAKPTASIDAASLVATSSPRVFTGSAANTATLVALIYSQANPDNYAYRNTAVAVNAGKWKIGAVTLAAGGYTLEMHSASGTPSSANLLAWGSFVVTGSSTTPR